MVEVRNDLLSICVLQVEFVVKLNVVLVVEFFVDLLVVLVIELEAW